MDLSWLQSEARTIHGVFEGLFYGLATVLVLISVVTDYFQIPLGGNPGFPKLIGRVLIAALLLHAFPEISNALADFTDSLASKIGNLNELKLVVNKLGDKLHGLSWSWTSVRQTAIVIVSFVTFFLVYLSVYLASAGVLYVWVLLYVFSPLLIALYVHPVTAGATSALFRGLFEVSAWKLTWAVLAALLWSTARIDLSQANDISLLTLIAYNLLLAISVVLTPLIVSALFTKGLASMAGSMLGMAAGAAALSPGKAVNTGQVAAASTGVGAAAFVAKGGMSLATKGASKAWSTISPRSVARKQKQSSPAGFEKDVPMPTEPPPWLARKLENEKRNRNK